ncbi:unnamed protein product, partial [Rotaria sp. Silwood2]
LGLIQCINDPDEATIDIFKNIWKVIDNYKLNIENLTSFGADNANAFYGKHHSVFQLLKDKVHHLLKGKYKRLLWDFLIIFIRPVHFALLYFRSAKRVENVKEYSEFVQVDFNNLLKHISTKWLSLLRSIQRLLDKFEPVKLYFLCEQTSTNIQGLLKSFFDNGEGLCILHFLQNVLFEIHKAELQLQRSYTTIVDLYYITINLINKLRQKQSDKYYDVADVIHIDDLDKDQLNSEFCDIKCLYDSLRKKNIKLCDQMKSYVSSKTNDFYALNITDQHVAYDECDDEEIISLSDKKDKDFIRSDELWAYLLNINPNATTNFKNLICYIFSILC